MSLLLRILFFVAMCGTVTSTIYCLMVIVAAVRFGVQKRREDRAETTFLPPVSVLKPLHGSEQGRSAVRAMPKSPRWPPTTRPASSTPPAPGACRKG